MKLVVHAMDTVIYLQAGSDSLMDVKSSIFPLVWYHNNACIINELNCLLVYKMGKYC